MNKTDQILAAAERIAEHVTITDENTWFPATDETEQGCAFIEAVRDLTEAVGNPEVQAG